MLTHAIQELTSEWPGYRVRGTTNKDHPVHKLVVQHIPAILESWTPNAKKYDFVGSDGKGNLLRAHR